MEYRPSAYALILLPQLALAWSDVGAQTVALVAQNYLSPDAVQQCQTILQDSSSNYLVNASSWAIDFSQTAQGAFTQPYHVLAALDSPPQACNTLLARDCPVEGCLAIAIANYTAILGDTKNTQDDRATALRMLIALVSEAAEPPHNDHLNDTGVPVLWQGVNTTLYDAWNRGMPNAIAGGDTLDAATGWAQYLVQSIDGGVVFPRSLYWLQDLSLCWPGATSMGWSGDANGYMCSAVIPDGADVLVGQELSGYYLAGNTIVVHRQVAKGGYRLAAWLNLILTGEPGLPVPQASSVPMCNTTALTSS